MTYYKDHLDVQFNLVQDSPLVPDGMMLLHMRVKRQSDQSFDRALAAFVKAAEPADYIAIAFQSYAKTSASPCNEYVIGAHCNHCVYNSGCEMKRKMLERGIKNPFCAAGEEFVIDEISSLRLGDTLRCAVCKQEFVLDENTFQFDSEAEYATCPHCNETRDIQYYL